MAKDDTKKAPDTTIEEPAPKVSVPRLVCKIPFEAWGTRYSVGDVVDPNKWPDHSRAEAAKSRVEHGFVSFEIGE